MEAINEEPINLLEDKYVKEHRYLFNEYKNKLKFFTETNDKLGLKAGDKVTFLNGYDVLMMTEILGFDEDGKAYMLWDCYWFAVDLVDRQYKLQE